MNWAKRRSQSASANLVRALRERGETAEQHQAAPDEGVAAGVVRHLLVADHEGDDRRVLWPQLEGAAGGLIAAEVLEFDSRRLPLRTQLLGLLAEVRLLVLQDRFPAGPDRFRVRR